MIQEIFQAAQLISLVRRFIGEKYFNCALNVRFFLLFSCTSNYLSSATSLKIHSEMATVKWWSTISQRVNPKFVKFYEIGYIRCELHQFYYYFNIYPRNIEAGMAILTVDREETRVIIQQRRFLRTDFNKGLRDTKWVTNRKLHYDKLRCI